MNGPRGGKAQCGATARGAAAQSRRCTRLNAVCQLHLNTNQYLTKRTAPEAGQTETLRAPGGWQPAHATLPGARGLGPGRGNRKATRDS